MNRRRDSLPNADRPFPKSSHHTIVSLRRGWCIALCVTAVSRNIFFPICFHTVVWVVAAGGVYSSTFNVTASLNRRDHSTHPSKLNISVTSHVCVIHNMQIPPRLRSESSAVSNGPRAVHPSLHPQTASPSPSPPADKPLRIRIQGPLESIQKLLPNVSWHKIVPFLQPGGLELASLTHQTLYGQEGLNMADGALTVRDEYLAWVMEGRRPLE